MAWMRMGRRTVDGSFDVLQEVRFGEDFKGG